ncbi:phospholipase A [Labilibaculum sp. K2S]|uniref:phospholipase A n=1 Tax=Labilibaculum sp. K2S TaxID=3056386 RepID=UPI0025A471C1|nr:phospholipase A [Labilibaculum sp. K2S]MDM8161151.1 phospholipase A [Labilibaculum sp. K2S]
MNYENYAKNVLLFGLFLVICTLFQKVNAQELTKEEFKDSIGKIPYFSIHKDNYFISGVPTNTSINRNTANAKYQISFKQMISRHIMPWDTYLFMTYSQTAFWDIYAESLPFKAIDFNPTISVGRAFFDKNHKLKGLGVLSLEHESNGRDSIFSRSWNRISVEYTTKVSSRISGKIKAWIPFGYKSGNPDILDYRGLGELELSYEAVPKQLYFEIMMRKGLKWEFTGTLRPRIYYNPFKNRSNQYLMLEWYVGQGEGLANYQKSVSMVRLGYVIKSNELNFLKRKRSR